MNREPYRSEIRDSIIADLLERVEQNRYRKYLRSVTLDKIRLFAGATISFDFPVVALIGPNGGGKTTVLAVCQCIYSSSNRKKAFELSVIGDEIEPEWKIEYEIIDRDLHSPAPLRGALEFDGTHWKDRQATGDKWGLDKETRTVSFLGVKRTLPLKDDANFHMRTRLTSRKKHRQIEYKKISYDNTLATAIRREGERVLGKSLSGYEFFTVTATVKKWANRRSPRLEHSLTAPFFVGKNKVASFSEINFGAGESSVLRIIAQIESMPKGSLILIDEIENGLHPVAVRRLVEYLIDVANRKNSQAIFTTHSDYALDPLPGKAIWACLDGGRVQQGKLSVEALRAVSGRVDKRLAVFVEDKFAEEWLTMALREGAREALAEVGIYAIGGDGNAVETQRAQRKNPAVPFLSLCYVDGDSRQKEDAALGVYRLPGGMPEKTIVESVMKNVDKNISRLTIACQMSPGRVEEVQKAIDLVLQTNRDPHLVFARIGTELGGVSENVVRGAFLSVWVEENPTEIQGTLAPILDALRQ
jgi:ABC-type multidrug transport system ATPase subunit